MTTDQQLVAACLDGEERAFAKLVDRYRYPVFGLCLGYVGDFDVAEDMAQEAFVSAYLHLHTLADAQFLGPWLKRIAINKCRSQWRRVRRFSSLADVAEEDLFSNESSVVTRLIEGEKRTEVLHAMDRLPESQRQVLMLFYLEDMSLRKIATFLGIGEASAKQRLYRARLTLKKEMLDMIKETVGGHELPPDFTEQVIKEALAQGQEKLVERDWQGAQEAFRKVVDVVPDHLEANRGLGLSLGGETDSKQRNSVFDDDALAKEAFETLNKAYQLGATDDGVVRRLSRLYSNFGRNREGGQFLESVAKTRTDWRDKIHWLRVAKSIYYHSHYRNGEDNKADCVRVHREIRALVPQNLDMRTKLAVWVPGGLVLAYAHVGLADEVFREMDVFEHALNDTCSVWDHYNIANARGLIHRELEQWEDEVLVGRAFLDWLDALPSDDPRFLIPAKTIQEDDKFEHKKVGEWVRWVMSCFMLNKIAQAEHALGRSVDKTFEQMDLALEANESYVADVKHSGDALQLGGLQRWLGGNYTRAGEAAFLAGQFNKALVYFAHEENALGQLDMHNPVYRVGTLATLGRMDEAIEQLDKIKGRLISTGQWRTIFESHQAFDAIRQDPRVIEILKRWQQAETVSQ